MRRIANHRRYGEEEERKEVGIDVIGNDLRKSDCSEPNKHIRLIDSLHVLSPFFNYFFFDFPNLLRLKSSSRRFNGFFVFGETWGSFFEGKFAQ